MVVSLYFGVEKAMFPLGKMYLLRSPVGQSMFRPQMTGARPVAKCQSPTPSWIAEVGSIPHAARTRKLPRSVRSTHDATGIVAGEQLLGGFRVGFKRVSVRLACGLGFGVGLRAWVQQAWSNLVLAVCLGLCCKNSNKHLGMGQN